MSIALYPKMLRGTINVPSSKTYTFINILLSTLCTSATKILNPDYSEEIITLINALEQLNVKFKITDEYLIVSPIKETVSDNKTIECKNYDSILMSLLLLSSSITKFISFHGDICIFELFDKQTIDNLPITYLKTNNTLNITNINNINELNLINIPSPYLIIGSILYGLYTKQDITLHINQKLINSPHLKMLQSVLQNYQVSLEISKESNVIYLTYQQPISPDQISIEGDWIQGAHYITMGLSNERLIINNLNLASHQPEAMIIDYLKNKNALISIGNNILTTENSFLKAYDFDLLLCPILSTLIICLSSISEGTSTLHNYDKLSEKYQSIILKLINILNSFGSKIIISENKLIIEGVKSLEGGLINEQIDSLITLSLLSISNYFIKPIEFIDFNNLNKTFPYFLEALKQIDVQIFERI